MRIHRAIIVALLAVVAFTVFMGSDCGSGNTSDKQDTKTTNDQQATYAVNQPIHKYDYSQKRDTLIQVYDQITRPSATWTVFVSATGVPLTICQSLGYPINAATQLTNPTKASDGGGSSNADTGSGNVSVGQAESTGVFSPASDAGTWVLCVRPNGDVTAVYSEPNVMTFPYKVAIKDGQIVDVGEKSSATIKPGASKVPAPASQP